MAQQPLTSNNNDDVGLAMQLYRLGLEGDYLHAANKYGMSYPEATHRNFTTGHAQDMANGYYSGGKMPWHPVASSESSYAPDAGFWTSKNGKDYYHPSPEQIQQGYLNGLAAYYTKNEPNTVIVNPAPYATIENLSLTGKK